jgi:hypothetical protein
MTAQDKIIDKIRKLLAKANGTNSPEEAAIFAQKAHELLVAHGIDEAQVITEGQDLPGLSRAAVKPRYDTPWFRGLSTAVAQYYMCGVVRSRVPGIRSTERYEFIGRESRTVVAASMYEYLEKTIYRLSNEASKDGVVRRNFQKGAAVNMAYRLVNMLKKAKADNPENLPSLYDQAKAEVDEYMSGVKTLKNRQLALSGRGYFAGAEAANNISVNTQVHGAKEVAAGNLLTR